VGVRTLAFPSARRRPSCTNARRESTPIFKTVKRGKWQNGKTVIKAIYMKGKMIKARVGIGIGKEARGDVNTKVQRCNRVKKTEEKKTSETRRRIRKR